MTATRVVAVRDIGHLAAAQAQWIARWIEDPLPGVHLVLVAGGGRTPAALDKACKAHAEIAKPATEETSAVLDLELRGAHLRLAPDAVARVTAHLGEDAGRVPELVELWASAYGDDAVLDLDDVEQYLGELGTAGPFELANAIDRGDVPRALEVLHRFLTATSGKSMKPMHPMQVVAMLSGHYRRLLALDDPAIATKEQAGEVLGQKPAAARFRLDAARNLGTGGLREAFRLLAQAELDLRGETALDERTVTEVLVARLAALSRRATRTR
jgi:DNA polymerase III delta subunit